MYVQLYLPAIALDLICLIENGARFRHAFLRKVKGQYPRLVHPSKQASRRIRAVAKQLKQKLERNHVLEVYGCVFFLTCGVYAYPSLFPAHFFLTCANDHYAQLPLTSTMPLPTKGKDTAAKVASSVYVDIALS